MLRRLPQRPLTPDELAAQVKVDEAYAQLERFNLTHLADGGYAAALSLGPRLRKVYDRYQRATEEQIGLLRALRTDHQRWLYDEAVKTGAIVPPQVVPDPRGDLEKEEKKERKAKEREAQKEADKLLLPESEEPAFTVIPPDPVQADDDFILDVVEDAALDYVENVVGRFYFRQHWAEHRNPQKLSEWLAEQGYEVDTDLVLAELDRLAQLPAWRS